ncbi:MAG: FMN-binding protein [Candidatus Eisenbacteria bacterium]|nr:FMN-binding protein [Candidatus Eisenbacteria bacterium]
MSDETAGVGGNRAEMFRITVSMAVVCALGAMVLGAVFVWTDRYQREASLEGEKTAVVQLLHLKPSASVVELRQFLAPARRQVVYRAQAFGQESGAASQIVFTLEGGLVSRAEVPAGGNEKADKAAGLQPLGRIFVARDGGQPAGFVVEGVSQGYKNKIRFLVALDQGFEVLGVRVVEHEEDPGLGAEVATKVFQAQYAGRSAGEIAATDVTRDPMPEDWRGALAALQRMPQAQWQEEYGTLRAREKTRPIYAVTGATISSRALTDGVRSTVGHFRRRWQLLEPYLGGGS